MSEHDLREGSKPGVDENKPKCPKCGKHGTLILQSSAVFGAYVECENDECGYDLATNDVFDFAQFFPIAAILEENQRLAKEFKLATKPYKELEEALALAEQWKQRADANREERNQLAERAEAAEAKLEKMREKLQKIIYNVELWDAEAYDEIKTIAEAALAE